MEEWIFLDATVVRVCGVLMGSVHSIALHNKGINIMLFYGGGGMLKNHQCYNAFVVQAVIEEYLISLCNYVLLLHLKNTDNVHLF